MSDMDAACLLKELSDYNMQGRMQTPQMSTYDTFFHCAFEHAIRALEERAGRENASYIKHPNGSYSVQ